MILFFFRIQFEGQGANGLRAGHYQNRACTRKPSSTDANDNVPNLPGQKHIRGLKHNNKKIRFNGWGSGR